MGGVFATHLVENRKAKPVSDGLANCVMIPKQQEQRNVQERERCAVVASRLALQQVADVCWNVLLREATLADD